jgi:hypothetical protein
MAHRTNKRRVLRDRAERKALSMVVDRMSCVICVNDTSFVPGKSNNGGCYSFTEEYSRCVCGCGDWIKEYHTSADFSYCVVDGRFKSCQGCFHDLDSGCDGEFEKLTTGQLLNVIREWPRNNRYVKYCN